jgi:hypothetical protein
LDNPKADETNRGSQGEESENPMQSEAQKMGHQQISSLESNLQEKPEDETEIGGLTLRTKRQTKRIVDCFPTFLKTGNSRSIIMIHMHQAQERAYDRKEVSMTVF